MEALKANGLVVASDWETAYYTNFSGSTGQGPQPMVVSYGSSPAAEVIFAETELEEAPTASIIGTDTCFRQIEFVGILKGTSNRDLAEAFIDFMLSVPYQEDLPMQMFVFPVNAEAALPDAFVENVQIPEEPASLQPALIDQHRRRMDQCLDRNSSGLTLLSFRAKRSNLRSCLYSNDAVAGKTQITLRALDCLLHLRLRRNDRMMKLK